VFADSRRAQTYFEKNNEQKSFDTWSFLSKFNKNVLYVKPDAGREIRCLDKTKQFSALLEPYLPNSEFRAVLQNNAVSAQSNVDLWPIAVNKFNETVSAILTVGEKKGIALIFPQIARKPEFLLDLIRTVLPAAIPRLFPYHEGRNWIHRPEYEFAKF
jgi:hypothetical protein